MPPLSVMIKPVSGACNMRCRYCFYADEMNHREKKLYPRMDINTLERVVRRVLACADESVSFAFQGGQPTLIGLDFFQALIAFEKKYNVRGLRIHNAVQSNGYDISDELIQFFAREGFLLGISLDGTKQTHDAMRIDGANQPTWEKITATIRKLKAAKVEFNVLCVVNASVAQNSKQVFEALAPYEYIQFIVCLDELDGTKRDYSLEADSYLSFLKTTFDLYYQAFMNGKPVSVRNFDNFISILMGYPPENCSMIGHCSRQLLIEGDGSVFPCDFYALDSWCLGNINEVPLKRMLKSERAQAFIRQSLPVPQACKDCKWYSLCRNGCKRERNAEGLNRWCEVMKQFFEHSQPRMLQMAQKALEMHNKG